MTIQSPCHILKDDLSVDYRGLCMGIFIIFSLFTFYCATAMQLSLSPEIKYDFSRVSAVSIAQENKLEQPLLKIKNHDVYLEKRLGKLRQSIKSKNIDILRKKLPLHIREYDWRHSSLLFDTIDENFPEGMQLLLDRGAFVLERDYQGFAPLAVAVQLKRNNLVSILLNYKGINPNTTGSREGGVPLICAVDKDLLMLKLLLQHKDIRVNIRDPHNAQTPLGQAIYDNNIEACSLLLYHKADPNDELINTLPLHYALTNRNYKIVNLLLEYKADPNKLSQKDVPEECASAYLKKYGSFIGYKEVGSTALHIAVKLGYGPENIDVLLRCGADPNKKNYFERPVIISIIIDKNRTVEYYLAVVKKLILAGANLNDKTEVIINNSIHMLTPYELAILLKKQEVAQLLANSQEFLREEAYKKFGTSIFKGTMLREMGVSSQAIKNFSEFDKK